MIIGLIARIKGYAAAVIGAVLFLTFAYFRARTGRTQPRQRRLRSRLKPSSEKRNPTMKLTVWALMLAGMISLAGCATSGEFCAVASPIRPSVNDVLTEDTQAQILKLNRYGEQSCRWKP
ncbi:hypothetical protein [Ensifer canadensis]|uniref:hypothetical protein n=1 Tax=Ensifer canadensis TaxID=555315 RepID=UPI0035E3CEDE